MKQVMISEVRYRLAVLYDCAVWY